MTIWINGVQRERVDIPVPLADAVRKLGEDLTESEVVGAGLVLYLNATPEDRKEAVAKARQMYFTIRDKREGPPEGGATDIKPPPSAP